MSRRTLGSIALIDGVGALLLLALLCVGTGIICNAIEREETKVFSCVALEDLRADIRQSLANMNMTSQPLQTGCFEVDGLLFSTEPPTTETVQIFFISDEEGVRVFYITEKD